MAALAAGSGVNADELFRPDRRQSLLRHRSAGCQAGTRWILECCPGACPKRYGVAWLGCRRLHSILPMRRRSAVRALLLIDWRRCAPARRRHCLNAWMLGVLVGDGRDGGLPP